MNKNLAERLNKLNIKADPDRFSKVLPCKNNREQTLYEAGYDDGYKDGRQDGFREARKMILENISAYISNYTIDLKLNGY